MKTDIGFFRVYDVTLLEGESQTYEAPAPIDKAELPNFLYFMEGELAYGPFPDVGDVSLKPGMTSNDVPHRPAGNLVMRGVEATNRWFCVHPLAGGRVLGYKVNLKADQTFVVAQHDLLIVRLGQVTLNGGQVSDGIRVAYAQNGPVTVHTLSDCELVAYTYSAA